MKLVDILEPVQLDETAHRTFKRLGNTVRRYFRCTSGPRAGTYASSPAGCAKRKDPGKVRHGKKVARSKGAVRVRKSKITKRRSGSTHMRHINNPHPTHHAAHDSSSATHHYKQIRSKSTTKSKKPKAPK